jgi:hypothetical protein
VADRIPTTILMDAVAGAGTGQFQDCPEGEGDIKILNGAGPDEHGNVGLSGTDCTWIDRPVQDIVGPVHPHTDYAAVPVPNTLRIQDDCKACCDCNDYGEAYQGMKRVWERALAVSRRVELLRQQYHELRLLAIEKAKIKCPEEVMVDLSVIPRPDYHLAVGVTAVNNTSTDLPSVTLQVCIVPNGYRYVPGSGSLNNDTVHTLRTDPFPVSCLPPYEGQGVAIALPPLVAGGVVNYTFGVRYYAGTPRHGRATVTALVKTAAGNFVSTKSVNLQPPLQKT